MFPQLSAVHLGHDRCKTHQTYALTCDQYDELRARCGDSCEICGRPAAQSGWGKLAIDHYATVGQWAVRGLLCTDCNLNMRRMPAGDERLQHYIDSAWYLIALDRAGISLGDYPEPPLRAIVGEPAGKHWKRVKAGWMRFDPYRHVVSVPETWDRLIYRYGPINLHHHARGDLR